MPDFHITAEEKQYNRKTSGGNKRPDDVPTPNIMLAAGILCGILAVLGSAAWRTPLLVGFFVLCAAAPIVAALHRIETVLKRIKTDE